MRKGWCPLIWICISRHLCTGLSWLRNGFGLFPRRKIEKTTVISYSLERLYHFRCGDCGKWWSVGDWTKVEYMYCPHCSEKGKTVFMGE